VVNNGKLHSYPQVNSYVITIHGCITCIVPFIGQKGNKIAFSRPQCWPCLMTRVVLCIWLFNYDFCRRLACIIGLNQCFIMYGSRLVSYKSDGSIECKEVAFWETTKSHELGDFLNLVAKVHYVLEKANYYLSFLMRKIRLPMKGSPYPHTIPSQHLSNVDQRVKGILTLDLGF
jgi:hypothetical protein